MPRKKDKAAEPTIESLAALWKELKLPKDALEGDLRDGCDDEADLMFENLKTECASEQLQFLYQHGYELGRLEELIREAATDSGTDA